MTDKNYDVFLSHSSVDKPAIERLAHKLRDEGVEPFLDNWHLVPGEPWQEGLEAALDRSRTCAVFLGPGSLGSWENEEMRAALDERVSTPGFRVIPVLLPGAQMPERGRLPRFLSRVLWVDFREGLEDAEAFHRLICGIRGIAPGPTAESSSHRTDICPYRGLQPFDEKDTQFFFGRAALTQWLVESLRSSHFLGVLGPSGCGKSSIVRAGLIPALRMGALPGSDQWAILLMTPGARPLEELAAHLSHLPNGGGDRLTRMLDLHDRLQADHRALHFASRLALTNSPPDSRVLLLVDQFEELFTLCQDETEKQCFLANLLYASGVAQGRTVVVVALRADFYSRVAVHSELADCLSDNQVLITPMLESELREAIELPAEQVGLIFDKGLVDTIIADVKGAPGTLPLMEHALLELWERRWDQRLTLGAYREIGGVEGAIARRAEAEHNSLFPEQQTVVRRVLLRLVQPGEGTEDTRRRAPLSELTSSPEQAPAVEAVIQKLIDVRLLTTSREAATGERMIDVVHEALIRGWPRLRGWIEEDRAALRTHRRLTTAANEWKQKAYDDSYLYRGVRLAEAEEWSRVHQVDLNVLEKDFLQASLNLRDREANEREARRRREIEAAQKLAESEKRRAETSTLLREVSSRINTTLDLSETLSLIVQGAMQLTNASSGVVYLFDETKQALTQSLGLPEHFQHPTPRLTNQEGLTWTIISTGMPVVIPDTETNECISPMTLASGIKSLIGVPLELEGSVIGVLYLNYLEKHRFTEEEKAILLSLAAQAATAIEKARLYDHISQNLERRIRELEVLTEIGRTVSNLGIDQILDLVYEQISRIMDLGNAQCQFALYDEFKDEVAFPLAVEQEEGEIIDLVHWGQREAPYQREGEDGVVMQFRPRVRRDPPGLTEYVIHYQHPLLIVEDFAQRASSLGIQIWPTFGRLNRPIQSYLGVPMIVGGRVIGTISIRSLKQEHAFDQEHVSLLGTVSNQAAVAIENARLYQQLNEKVLELQGAYREVADRERELATTSQAMDFVHRINNLAGPIAPWVTLVKRELSSMEINNPKVTAYLDRIVEDASLILREASESMSSRSEPVEIDLQELIASVITQVELMTQTSIDFSHEPELPTVFAVKQQISSAIYAILQNAVKATSDKGRILIELRTHQENAWQQRSVKIIVSDTGCGIPADRLDSIFEYGTSYWTGNKSTGYGLWRARSTVQSIGGSLELTESVPGEGSTFTMLIPAMEMGALTTKGSTLEANHEA